MIKKVFLLMSLSAFLFWSCGEAGFQSDISKKIEVDPTSLSVSVPDVSVGLFVPATLPVTVSTGVIDIAGDGFEDFLSDAEFFKINEMSMNISNFPSGNSANLEFDVSLSIAGGAPQPFISTTINNIQNSSGDIVLYTKDNPGVVNANTIAQLEQALKNGQSFGMEIVAVGRDVTLQTPEVGFDLTFAFDVTARIQLN